MIVLPRRVLLRGIAGLGLGARMAQAGPGHDPFGPVAPPQAAPSLWLLRDDGRQIELRRHLTGNVTAVQLMFTRCTATCPIQGALFGSIARRVRAQEVQLLSLSIDPPSDTPAALRAWLARFSAPAHWRAAAPRSEEVDRLFEFVRGRASGADQHTTQVYLFDRQARFVFRTASMPSAGHVADVCAQIAAARG